MVLIRSVRYKVTKPIQVTDNSIVYQAVNDKGETVAIKEITIDKRKHLFAAKREIKLLLNLRHCKYIIDLLDYQIDDQRAYLVFPYYSTCLIDLAGRLSKQKVKNIARQLIEGISAIHEHNWVHNDIKVENVMLDGDNVILIDLGMVSRIGEKIDLCGSPHYIAKRKLLCYTNNKPIISCTDDDWWSLLVTIGNITYGSHIYDGYSEKQIMENIIEDRLNIPSYNNVLSHLLIDKLTCTKVTRKDIINSEWLNN